MRHTLVNLFIGLFLMGSILLPSKATAAFCDDVQALGSTFFVGYGKIEAFDISKCSLKLKIQQFLLPFQSTDNRVFEIVLTTQECSDYSTLSINPASETNLYFQLKQVNSNLYLNENLVDRVSHSAALDACNI